ncbi:MAG: CCA tRNA nucleotidyltransferase [Candidatus Bilamarchaeaceae archaeon]
MNLGHILAKIRPSKKEEYSIKKISNEIAMRLRKASRQEIVLAGSVAKDTALAGEGDIDIFILFKKKISKEEMKERLEKIFKKAFPSLSYQMNYAEHPYIKFHYLGKKVDVVPAYKIAVGDSLLTAVDRSVLHTKFILKNLKEKQKDEVRLLKKFLKTAGLYGAEIRVEGFSGYLCELLVIRYGSFLKTLRNASKWQIPVIIDLKKYYKKSDYRKLVEKFNKSFIVIDPTDKNRNVAAPVSEENFKKFIRLARAFLKKPSEKYFAGEKTFDERLRSLRRKKFVVFVRFKKPEVVDDVLWGQVKRLISILKRELIDYGISSIIAHANCEIIMAILARKKESGGKKEIVGPPLSFKEHAMRFRKAHSGCVFKEKNGRLIAIVNFEKKGIVKAVEEVLLRNKDNLSHLPLSEACVELD